MKTLKSCIDINRLKIDILNVRKQYSFLEVGKGHYYEEKIEGNPSVHRFLERCWVFNFNFERDAKKFLKKVNHPRINQKAVIDKATHQNSLVFHSVVVMYNDN